MIRFGATVREAHFRSSGRTLMKSACVQTDSGSPSTSGCADSGVGHSAGRAQFPLESRDMAAWTTGASLGPYVLLAPIGAGGMGEVWKARDTRLDRIVAIKTSRSSFGALRARGSRGGGAESSAHLPALRRGAELPGDGVHRRRAAEGAAAFEKAVEFAGQILEALDAAHRKGITHRDLKPANILVTRAGDQAAGLRAGEAERSAQQDRRHPDGGADAAGEIVGTLQYMSPEQLQGKETDARSDLFAFGCVLVRDADGETGVRRGERGERDRGDSGARACATDCSAAAGAGRAARVWRKTRISGFRRRAI